MKQQKQNFRPVILREEMRVGLAQLKLEALAVSIWGLLLSTKRVQSCNLARLHTNVEFIVCWLCVAGLQTYTKGLDFLTSKWAKRCKMSVNVSLSQQGNLDVSKLTHFTHVRPAVTSTTATGRRRRTRRRPTSCDDLTSRVGGLEITAQESSPHSSAPRRPVEASTYIATVAGCDRTKAIHKHA